MATCIHIIAYGRGVRIPLADPSQLSAMFRDTDEIALPTSVRATAIWSHIGTLAERHGGLVWMEGMDLGLRLFAAGHHKPE